MGMPVRKLDRCCALKDFVEEAIEMLINSDCLFVDRWEFSKSRCLSEMRVM